jgi:hypothetical protein
MPRLKNIDGGALLKLLGSQPYSEVIIEIGLEQAPFVFYLFFPSFENVKSLLIMGPTTLKTHH